MKSDLERADTRVGRQWVAHHSLREWVRQNKSSILWLPILCFAILFACQYYLMVIYKPIKSDYDVIKTEYGLYTYKGNQDNRDSYLNGKKIYCVISYLGVSGSCHESYNNQYIKIYFVELNSIWGFEKYIISINNPPLEGYQIIEISKWHRLSYLHNFFISLFFSMAVFIYLLSFVVTIES